jgi:hypothetical protein
LPCADTTAEPEANQVLRQLIRGTAERATLVGRESKRGHNRISRIRHARELARWGMRRKNANVRISWMENPLDRKDPLG